jgi:hypothetical protein
MTRLLYYSIFIQLSKKRISRLSKQAELRIHHPPFPMAMIILPIFPTGLI